MNNPTQTNWIGLVETPQQDTLARLLETAPRSKEEQAHHMLASPPWPADQADAESRVLAVIRYLARGYRVGDLHPATRY